MTNKKYPATRHYPVRRPATRAKWKRIYARYLKSGLSLRAFCKETGIVYVSAVVSMARCGFPLDHTRGQRGRKPSTLARLQRIVGLLNQGKSYEEVGAVLGVTRQRVQQLASRYLDATKVWTVRSTPRMHRGPGRKAIEEAA